MLCRVDETAEKLAAAVAAELRAERAAQNLTIAELADLAGMPAVSLGRYLNHEREIPVPTFLTLCRALHVTGAAIFERAEKRLEQL